MRVPSIGRELHGATGRLHRRLGVILEQGRACEQGPALDVAGLELQQLVHHLAGPLRVRAGHDAGFGEVGVQPLRLEPTGLPVVEERSPWLAVSSERLRESEVDLGALRISGQGVAELHHRCPRLACGEVLGGPLAVLHCRFLIRAAGREQDDD